MSRSLGVAGNTTSIIFLDDFRRKPLEPIVPHSLKNGSVLPPNLTPRKGQFTSSPWQRHGKIVPLKTPL